MITSVKDIAQYIGKEFYGWDFPIATFSPLSNIEPRTIVFAKKYKEEIFQSIGHRSDILAIVTEEYSEKLHCSYIISDNPRLDFIRILSHFFEPVDSNRGKIHPTATIEGGASLGANVTIGANCYISAHAAIGDNTIIHPNVTIDNIVQIGKDCEIKSGAVIGQSGFGFERDSNKEPVHFPHFGRVIIKDNVYIGANTAIDRGTLGDTVIENNAKIDNLVHIAHNCHIGEGSFVIATAILGGGTQIGRYCWVAPNVSIKEQTVIHDDALIGLGAVVLKDVEEGSVMVGNPAKQLIKNK